MDFGGDRVGIVDKPIHRPSLSPPSLCYFPAYNMCKVFLFFFKISERREKGAEANYYSHPVSGAVWDGTCFEKVLA